MLSHNVFLFSSFRFNYPAFARHWRWHWCQLRRRRPTCHGFNLILIGAINNAVFSKRRRREKWRQRRLSGSRQRSKRCVSAHYEREHVGSLRQALAQTVRAGVELEWRRCTLLWSRYDVGGAGVRHEWRRCAPVWSRHDAGARRYEAGMTSVAPVAALFACNGKWLSNPSVELETKPIHYGPE